MAGNSLGTSYVQVVPKFKNGSLADMGKQAGSAFEGGFGAALKKVAGLLATSAIIKGIYDIGKAAVSAYADFEQLTGGVETLYKESADELIANAQRAYMTAGISANEYMEMSTSFAAALVNSLGGNTAEAARLADVAITDMSDNANKMGTDMEAIQNAYQGFAKQNYTMLDNLKLGYGGTRTEMERLLADAEAISGIHYDIENYSDVVSAIHVIQEEMGIAGTTAEEAASTISGSWGMLKASWENLLVSLAGGGDDIDTAVKAVFDSLMTWLGNIGPRIAEVARGIFEAIPAVAAQVMEELPPAILDAVEDAFGSDARETVEGFLDEFGNVAQGIEEFASELMGAFQPLADFLSGKGDAFAGMMERIQGHLDDLAPHLEHLRELWTEFKTAVLDLVEAAAPVAAEFFGYLMSAITGLLPIIAQIAESFLAFATGTIEVITAFIEDAKTGFEGFRTALSETWEAIKTAVGDAVQSVKDKVVGVFTSIKETATSIWNGIKSAIEGPINSAKDSVKSAIDKIRGFFDFKFSWPHIPLPHFSITGSVNPIDWLTSGLPQIGISWYGHGGFYDEPTVMLPGVGERGREFVWPDYEPEFSRYAAAIASRMGGASTVNNYYIDGSLVSADARLAAALDTVAQRVGGRRRMGVA